MTPSELKAKVADTGSHYFNKDTMQFFGDSMSNYGVHRTTIVCNYTTGGKYVASGITVDVYELHRKKPVKNGLQASVYFDANTFQRRYPIAKE